MEFFLATVTAQDDRAVLITKAPPGSGNAVEAGRPTLFVGEPVPRGECTLAELARVLVPGGLDPYRAHGLVPGEHRLLAEALHSRLMTMDTGLLHLVASLLRGPAPTVAAFLAAMAEQRASEGMAPQPVTAWVATHKVPETRFTTIPVAPLDVDKLAHMIGWSGPLAQAMDGYEARPQQLEVLRQVAGAFNNHIHLAMEAPTGTGKSLAYLIPAAAWAIQNEERVLIATHTIALQEQLLAKDLPLLGAALGRPVKAAVLKGRSHYVCLRKWEEGVQALDFQTTDGEADFYGRISAWLGQTETGDKGEVLVGPEDERAWQEIASETATCIGPRCKWFAGHCFAHRARREAHQSDLLITNHALLCAQLHQGNQAFPSFFRVVIDEAHHLEAVATDAFTLTCSFEQVQIALHGLFAGVNATAGGEGLFRQLSHRLARPLLPEGSNLVFPEGKDLIDLLIDVVVDGRAILAECRHLVEELTSVRGESQGEGRGAVLRLTPALLAQPRLATTRASIARLSGCLLAVAQGLTLIAGALSARNEEPLAAGVRGRVARLTEAGEALRGAVGARLDTVAWAEAGRDLIVKFAPLYAGAKLKEKLFDAYPSVALVSATLAIAGSFDFVAGGVGLDLTTAVTATVDSPFAWREQALLCAVDDGPVPRGSQDPAYVAHLAAVLSRLLPAVGGRTLVLFTANAVLKETLSTLRQPMLNQGIQLLGQGVDGTVVQLIERLKAERNVVLFGSGSFWEGIDVAGEALSCLVVTRLPFRPPSSPLAQARAEQEEKLGRNPFTTLALPEAVIRFKQGFGRLIRTRQDRGVVVVLDNRILPERTEYGALFLSSLPPVSRVKGGVGAMIRRTVAWLDESST